MTALPTVADEVALPSWEEVLAEVDADVARTEELLRTAATPDAATPRGPLSPAELMLPAPAPVLPDPAHMPPVPVALATRLQVLQGQIETLSGQLATALDELRSVLTAATVREPALGVPGGPTAPRFVDRRL